MRETGALWLLLLAQAAVDAAAQSPLPTGFGTLSLGAPWSTVEHLAGYTELTRPATGWDRLVHECGYRSGVIALDRGRLLVTTRDFRITSLGRVTPIEPGSDIVAVAQSVIEQYGPPARRTLRDALGATTEHAPSAAYVDLEYDGAAQARFTVSAAPLWEFRISITHNASRQFEERNTSCAHERERAERKPP